MTSEHEKEIIILVICLIKHKTSRKYHEVLSEIKSKENKKNVRFHYMHTFLKQR